MTTALLYTRRNLLVLAKAVIAKIKAGLFISSPTVQLGMCTTKLRRARFITGTSSRGFVRVDHILKCWDLLKVLIRRIGY